MRSALRSLPVLVVLVLVLLVTGCRPRTDAAVTYPAPTAALTCSHDCDCTCDCGCRCECGCCDGPCQ